ncbi:Tify [Corchorus olitorius]|uniref:Protein TIFY n=1 Tax=Corchorus olitorius TaxID=93759 RepID=A0A1R3J0W1_9ROSI|nr:Tify [Corchorus olitorius]
MSRATVELDFFGMEKENSCKSQFQKFLDRRRSFRGLQGAISKMNPELIKSVISSGLTNNQNLENLNQLDSNQSFSVPSSPKEAENVFPTLPILSCFPATAAEKGPETAPLTIFYNGTVSIFNVPRDKVDTILKLAVEGSSKNVDSKVATPSTPSDQQQVLENLNGGFPPFRRKSLQRFLEKRKQRY